MREQIDHRLGKGSTLVELLRERASGTPDRVLYTYLADGETETASLTCGELERRARALGVWLQEHGAGGERVLLLTPPGLDAVAAFFGCLLAGAVAVPAYPPRARRPDPRLREIVRDAAPRVVLTTAALLPRVEADSGLTRMPTLAIDRVPEDLADVWRDPGTGPDDLAFLQYTSGSTSDPKGVAVTHRNLLHNEEMIRRAFGQSEESVIVGWLPLYHDMGLIGNVLQPLYSGARCVLMPPLAFLQRPVRWLAAVSRYRATTSGGPNFAYDLCTRRIGPEERAGLDLSSWSVAFNGAEPVWTETLERFDLAFAPRGFRRQAFHPCYGLAEATLLVSSRGPGTGARVRAVDAGALAQDRIEPPRPGFPHRELVSCGRPWLGQEILIADPASGDPLPAGRVGEVWLSGPSVARGYFGRPAESEQTFAARSPGRDERFLRTGDLGFLDGGELFLTGRLKELIILRGRNLYPQDLERTAAASHAALQGLGAAFAVDGQGEEGRDERLILVCEVARTWKGGPAAVEEVAEAVRRAVAEEHEARVHEIVLVRPGGVPRTTSGKIQRALCRRLYREGGLMAAGRSRAGSPASELEAGAIPVSREALLGLPAAERAAALETWLLGAVAATLAAAGAPFSRPGPGTPLAALGLDSLAAIELAQRVDTALGVAVPAAELLGGVGAAGLARTILAILEGDPAPAAAPAALGGTGDPEPGILSHGERALWFLHRVAPQSAAYHIAAAARCAAEPDVAALRRAFFALAARHAGLRTTFEVLDGEPRRRIAAEPEIDFAVVDAAGWTPGELAGGLDAAAHGPFDLERGPLLRVRVFRDAPGGTALCLAIHHAVADFWSLAVIARELGVLYGRERGEDRTELPPVTASGADYALFERERLRREGDRLWDWWRERLAGAPPGIDLPTDRPRPAVASRRGAAAGLRLEPAVAAAVRGTAREQGVTPFLVLLAAFQVLLHRHAGQDDLVVGTPTADRGRPELAGLVGYLVNPVPVRIDLGGRPSFADLLARTREAALCALAHRDFPFSLLAERLQPDRDPGRSPLFQVMLVLHRPPVGAPESLAAFAMGEPGARLELGSLVLESMPLAARAAQLDLTLHLAAVGGGLAASLEFAADLFDEATARRLLERFRVLLAAAPADPRRPIAELPLLTEAEAAQVHGAWSGAESDPGMAGLCLHQLFEAQAKRTPEAVAVVWGDREVSYRTLDARADRLGRRLASLGAGPEKRVAVLLDRTPGLVVALLAVLKAGAAYVPLDPAYPGERLALLLQDAGARLAVTAEAYRERLAALPVVVDADGEEGEGGDSAARPSAPVLPGNLAYLVYTSGSTGTPKAVAVEHRSAVARMLWAREVFPPADLAGVLAATPVCFDLSVFELFAPLSWGGTAVLAGNALDLPAVRWPVTLVNTVPSAMAELVRAGLPPSVRTVNLAGEPLPGALARRILQGPGAPRLFNLYGPSEDTTYSTGGAVEADTAGEPPIGRPLAGTRAWVLDGRPDTGLQPVPPGVAGELFLAGAGLARGYLGRPELTAERFVPDPFDRQGGGRLYRTGDRVRHRPDGRLRFLGRADRQVKVRGFRIEPGEIEAALARHPAVRECAVLARDEPGIGARLVAYAALEAETAVTAAALRSFLAGCLPAPLVPAGPVLLGALPRTPHGKVDLRALSGTAAEPEHTADGSRTPPRTAVEAALAEIWREVLEGGPVGARDDFFALGGHSLLAARVLARVREAFGAAPPLAAFLAAPTLEGLAREIETALRSGMASSAPPPPAPAPRTGLPPLSFAQQRFWFLDRLEPGSAACHVPLAARLSGALDERALAAALGEIVRRHEVLRTRLVETGGAPAQVIVDAAAAGFRLPVADLRHLPAARRWGAARRSIAAESARPFDLARGPVLRALLLRLDAAENVLALTLHHAACDGWSLGVLARELGVLYPAFASAASAEDPHPPPAHLAPLPLQVADHAIWQRSWLCGEALAELLAPWRERLAGVPPLDLPADRPRPPVPGPRGGLVAVTLPPAAVRVAADFARRHGCTLYMVLLAGFEALLGRWAGQTGFAVGSPAANRGWRELEGLIGCFVNTLVLRADLTGDPTGAELARRARETSLAAFAGADLPFEKLVEELAPARDLGRSPLFQAMLVLHNAPLPALALGAVALVPVEPWELEPPAAKLDLTLSWRATDEGLAGTLEYRAELFDRTTALRAAGHLATLLAGLTAAPERRWSDLPLLSAPERAQVAIEWNDTGEPPAGELLHAAFLAQARRTPGAVAVACRGEDLTYGELAARAARLAHRLRELGAGPEVRVGVWAGRTPGLVTALLGVLQAGGAYVPLDPVQPAERLALILAGSGARALVAVEEPARLAPFADFAGLELPVVLLDRTGRIDGCGGEDGEDGEDGEALPVPAADPANLSHVLFTSGSTGRPKGVAIEHRGAAALVRWAVETFAPADLDAVLAATSIGFDLSVFEIFVPLSRGGRVVLAENVLALPWLPEAGEVTLVNTVPSAMAELIRLGPLPGSVRAVCLAGEPLPRSVVDEIYARGAGSPALRVWNLYGPTEDTTYSTAAPLAPGEAGPPPIGRPLAGTRARVLDAALRPVPVGAQGELCLAGAGLARGYLGRPDLTAERFVPDPRAPKPGGRLYRTGDLARLRTDGRIDYLGRADLQVKVRGVRIEPGEVEAILTEHPAIGQAVVVARGEGPGSSRLAAYVVPRHPVPDGSERLPEEVAAELRGLLGRRLPEPMIPAWIVPLRALPVTPNGKVDRRALPDPGRGEPVSRDTFAAPSTPREAELAALWAEVLGCERVGIHDDFFALGGHSLLAMRLIARMREACAVEVPVQDLFRAPTVARFSRLLVERENAAGEPVETIPAIRPAARERFRVHRRPGENAPSGRPRP